MAALEVVPAVLVLREARVDVTIDSNARPGITAGDCWMRDLSMSTWVMDVSVSRATASPSAWTTVVAVVPARPRATSFTTGALPRTSTSAWNGCEALDLDGQVVRIRGNVVEQVRAVGAGPRLLAVAGDVVDEDDGDAGERLAVGSDHVATDLTGGRRGRELFRKNQEDAEKK